MTTHNNTPKDQYHRAPLNGLIIGTIVGAAWAIEFLLPFLFPMGRYSRNIKMAFIALTLPVLGWITGLWGRTACNSTTPAKKKRRVKTAGIAMATTISGPLTSTPQAQLARLVDSANASPTNDGNAALAALLTGTDTWQAQG